MSTTLASSRCQSILVIYLLTILILDRHQPTAAAAPHPPPVGERILVQELVPASGRWAWAGPRKSSGNERVVLRQAIHDDCRQHAQVRRVSAISGSFLIAPASERSTAHQRTACLGQRTRGSAAWKIWSEKLVITARFERLCMSGKKSRVSDVFVVRLTELSRISRTTSFTLS